ncbi:uncharacterized protein LOC127247461 isoform X2 [Andrographis paniculata]|uniref:uncharacterized protein LOC127247461 isoform X2 n=1 Tax=Andrographis paniculata TaxID=175694 RepID=UPI0021E7B5E4|nr:uncharacterized protein LOC127247461 isoform X2 [Andrographis paniculata]
MEGVGSRQSRAASRYSSSPSAPVFNGPVRKWKKQWVSSRSTNHNNGSSSSSSNRNDSSSLLLCRWTPIPAAEEPRKRRRRYAPIVPIEKGKKMDGVEKMKISNDGRGDTSAEETTQVRM